MRSTPLKLLAVAAALSLAGAALGNPLGDAGGGAVAEVSAYKSWARVTLKPVAISVASVGG